MPNKTDEVNLKVLNMIKGLKELKAHVKHILCECIYKFDSINYTSEQKYNNASVIVNVKNQ